MLLSIVRCCCLESLEPPAASRPPVQSCSALPRSMTHLPQATAVSPTTWQSISASSAHSKKSWGVDGFHERPADARKPGHAKMECANAGSLFQCATTETAPSVMRESAACAEHTFAIMEVGLPAKLLQAPVPVHTPRVDEPSSSSWAREEEKPEPR
jgi:hypothetical protein